MKLVQKTLLASAIAVAFSSAAFADVTVSGKVAGEVQVISKSKNSNNDALSLGSDGIKFALDGKYDIIGGNQAGFKFGVSGNKEFDENKYEAGDNIWQGKQAVTVDKAHLFLKGDWGKFAFGRLTLPSDDVKNDIWDNSVLAASDGEFAGGSSDNALGYSFENDQFTLGVAVAAINKQFIGKDAKKRKMVTGDQFKSDIAATVTVGPVKLKAGANYDAKYKQTKKLGVVGIDYEADGLVLTGTVGVYGAANVATDLILGAGYAFTDVVTGKVTLGMTDVGDKANEDGLNPMQFSIGADYTLAKNITAFTVLSYKNKDSVDYADALAANIKDKGKLKKGEKLANRVKELAPVINAKDQFGLGVGMTLKF